MSYKSSVKITNVQIEEHYGGWILICHKYGVEYLNLEFVRKFKKFKRCKTFLGLTRKLKKEWIGKEIVLIDEIRGEHYTTTISVDSVYDLLARK